MLLAASSSLRHRQHRWLTQALERAGQLPAYARSLAALPTRLDTFERLERLPVVEREDIQARPEAYRNPDFASIEIHTSGSTATPLTYHLEERARKRRLVQYARFFWIHGWRPWHRSLTFKVLPDSSERVGSSWLDRTFLARRRVLSVLEPVRAQLRALRALDPEILHGLPSTLGELLGQLDGESWRPRRLRRVFTSSEALDPKLRGRLETGLGAPVVDHYGAAEAFVGWECERRRGYHVNVRSVLVEILDSKSLPVEPGGIGRVVLTTLDNPAMPLLRYAIGDRAVQGDGAPCPCGRPEPLLPSVLGRVVDAFHLPDGPVSPWGTLARMREIPELMHFQLVQIGPNRVQVRVQPQRGGRLEPERIARLVRESLYARLEVEVRETRTFLRLPSGKFAPALRRLGEPTDD